jgi:hypothetical protein
MRVIIRIAVLALAAVALAISGTTQPAPMHTEQVAYPPICC